MMSSMMRRCRYALLGGALAITLAACASGPEIPAGAERQVRTESNGDVVEDCLLYTSRCV